MSRESTREYYRRKAQEEREGKNDSAKSTTSSTREYYRKKAQEEREAQQPDTNKVSGGASGSGPIVNNSTTTKPNLPAKPAKPTEPTVNTPVQDTARNSAAVKYEIDELAKQRTELERERAALLSNRKTAVSPRVKELGEQIKEIRGQLDTLSAEFEQLETAEKQALIDSGEYRDASFKDFTLNALKQGWYNSMYGEASYYDMMGADNEKQKYEDILAGEDYKFIPSNAFEEAISGAANLLGQQARQWTHPRSLAAGSAAALATFLAGQAGPQVLAPEEFITVPGAFVAGIAAGSTTSNFEIEAGFAYNEMLEQGISPETARNVALAVGGANAALEMVQADELIKSFKVLKGTKATQGVAGRIAQELLDRGIDVAKETAQEVAQEGATIAGTQIGSKIDKGEWAYSAGDVVDRLGDTAKNSMLSFGVMNVPGGTYNTYNILRDQQNQQNQEAQVQNDPEATIEEAALELVRREAEQAAREAEIAPQESVSREDVSVPTDNENATQRSEIEAAAMEMAEEDMRSEQLAEEMTLEEAMAAFNGGGKHDVINREAVEQAVKDGSVSEVTDVAQEATQAEGATRNGVAVLTNYAKQAHMGENGLKAIEDFYDANENPETAPFYGGFAAYWNAGYNNKAFEEVSLTRDAISDVVKHAAYNAGKLDAIQENAAKPVEIAGAQEYNGTSTSTTTKKKTITTKKSDWASTDVEWHVPNAKRPIAYSTKATSDYIEVLADENPAATISELQGLVNYDQDAKKVLQQYIDAGHGDQVASEWFSYDRRRGYTKEASTNENQQERDMVRSESGERGAEGSTDSHAPVAEVSDARGARELDAAGHNAGGLLDGVAAQNVQENEEGRNTVPDAEIRGRETGGADDRADAGTQVPDGRSSGDYQGGSVRPASGGVSELTDAESEAVKAYKSSESYKVNAKLRDGVPMDTHEQSIVDGLDSALEKLPVYKGTVYRNLEFDTFGGKEALDEFMSTHKEGMPVFYKAFTSASTDVDGYPLEGEYVVRMVIESVNGRNLEGYGNNFESEVLFKRESDFDITKVTYDENGNPTIYIQEVAENGTGQLYTGERSETVRDLPEHDTVHSDVQGVSERNTEGNTARGEGPQGTLPGGQRSEVRPGKSGETHERTVREEVSTEEQIEKKAELGNQEQPKGANFVIGEKGAKMPTTPKARYKANADAIKTLRTIMAEGRMATPQEQETLAKYTGWGGLSDVFDERKTDWAKEFKQLKKLLDEGEYKTAKGSILDAYYTEPGIIRGMYNGLASLGFTGGRMLEPSAGVGRFIGAMPQDMLGGVRSWTAVELDKITGNIAKYLYPNADVRVQGYESAKIPDGYMDVVIGNVPFGNIPIADKAYPASVTKSIHNYFIAKSLDKLRPGGILTVITSRETMDATGDGARAYFMKQADLIGAIRLPNTAFEGTGTNVVSDILVFKKREPGTAYKGESFLTSEYHYLNDGTYGNPYAAANEYFDKHPEMVLGKAKTTGGRYGETLTYDPLDSKLSLQKQIEKAFGKIKVKMDYPAQRSQDEIRAEIKAAAGKVKQGGLVSKDGKLYRNDNGMLTEATTIAKADVGKMSDILAIRDEARNLLTLQLDNASEATIKTSRDKLNKLYDAFVKKYGSLNQPKNKKLVQNDVDSPFILALEDYNKDSGTAKKAAIFNKNTIKPMQVVTHADTVDEALTVSLNETGTVDVKRIAQLTGQQATAVEREMLERGLVFKNRDGNLETAEVYLSGNVRAKLRDAEALAEGDADYKRNVEALKEVIPADIPAEEIKVRPGATWIPDNVYSAFAGEMLGGAGMTWRGGQRVPAVEVKYNRAVGKFFVEINDAWLRNRPENTSTWGTEDRPFIGGQNSILEAALNNKTVSVFRTVGETRVMDKQATAAAQEKLEKVLAEFQSWLWKDETRRTELGTLYNDVFNNTVTPKYDGSHLTVNGSNPEMEMRPHQKNAVQRIINSGGNTLLAHRVGAGKTYEMAAAAMKLRQLGIVKKPLFTVPKHLVAQWGNEFLSYFPAAKILVLEHKDFTPANRKLFANRIATGDYDAVIMSYEQFGMVPMSQSNQEAFYQEQIDALEMAILESKRASGKRDPSVRDMERSKKTFEAKLKKLGDGKKDADNIDFEQLGIDALFVDEAHNFKNLFYNTKMQGVADLGDKDGSQRAFDLYMKVRHLQRLNGGRGIVFATATPVMNSVVELYTMQRYLQGDLLDAKGLTNFDAWANQFGDVVTIRKMKTGGNGYELKQSLSKYKNLGEMQQMFRGFADVITDAADLPYLKIPTMKGGKRIVVECEPSAFQEQFMEELGKRAEALRGAGKGGSEDHIFKVFDDGKKISFTQRMIDSSLPYEDGGKIMKCAENVLDIWKRSKADKGTQLIFCDRGTPGGAEAVRGVSLYEDIKNLLVGGGVPESEIAFIHDATSEEAKAKLFKDVNEGTVRVLIGSTAKMGTGMNVQKRIVALHELNAPDRPGDLEQNEGRALRQGNMNSEVEVYAYVTKKTFDSRQWDNLKRKATFIHQIMAGEYNGREADGDGDLALSAAEISAIASDNPLIMEQFEVSEKIANLENLERAHTKEVAEAKRRIATAQKEIASDEEYLGRYKSDLQARQETAGDKFRASIGGKTLTERKTAGEAIIAAAKKALNLSAETETNTEVGSFAGFKLYVTSKGDMLLRGKAQYRASINMQSPVGTIQALEAMPKRIDGIIATTETRLSENRAAIAKLEKTAAAPFDKANELIAARVREAEILAELNPPSEREMEALAEVDAEVDHDIAVEGSAAEERWKAERVGDANKAPKSLAEIIEGIRHDFGLNITTGHIRGKDVRGQYGRNDSGIRTKIAQDLPTVAHELGHHFDTVYEITDSKELPDAAKTELENGLNEETKAVYKEDRWLREGMAEFMRKYLQNRETAAIDYPEFTKHFMNTLSGRDAAQIKQLADEVNAYYSLDADTATSSIRLREEGNPDARTVGEKIKAKMSVLYQAWMDSNHGIKEFDKATGANTYKLASNAAYSDAIAGQLITGDLTDANGQYVAPGLKTALHGLNLKDKTEYRMFGEYLTVKHGPERLAEGMRIFADDRKNSSAFMARRQAELEAQYPHFAEVSERLYEFQKQFLQTWGVGTGLVSSQSAKEWAERWEFYVPLNRAVSEEQRRIGAKRGFANQNSTIKKARGSGLDVVHPVDNIVNNIVKMVNAGVRNNVMRAITDAAQSHGADATYIEKVPVPLVRRGFDMTGVKTQLTDWFEESDMSTTEQERAAGIVNNLDDILYQYGKGKAHGDVITVLKGGEQEFWKINDPQLLASVTTMAPKRMEGVFDAYAVVSRFMTSNITGNNLIWSLFSNFPRDIMTMFTYSKVKNPVRMFGAMGSAFVNKVKDGAGMGVDPLYQEFLAMGGGKTSAYTADRDLAKRARKKLAGMKISSNPLDWVSYVGDLIELGPRFATYKVLRQNGLGSQEAFYEAMDITVNFRRGGTFGREVNKVVPFFNASVQGLDKFRRWITAEDVSGAGRKKVVAIRTISYIAASAALAAIVYALNNGDDEEEKNYEQLSNFTKNSYWSFPLGDGKYLTIPKPREIAVLSSFFETCMEYGIGDNDHAFDEFYAYAADNFLPPIASDFAKGDLAGVIGNFGIVGVGSYMVANRDFLGRPIVSSGLQNLEPKDQYTDRTSKIAYWVGRAFNVSPQMVDYFFNSVLGGWWKTQKALFPVGKENVDVTLGIQNSYVKDNQYSTDLVNWMYDKADASKKAKNSDKANMEKAITAKTDGNMTSFYSEYYALAKNAADTTANRGARQVVLDMILEYRKAADAGYVTKAQAAVYEICEKAGSTEYLPGVMQSTIKDGKEIEHTLSPAQYVEYQTDYNRMYWEYVEEALPDAHSDAEKLAVLDAAKTVAKENATAATLARIGAPASKFTTKYSGVSTDNVIDFLAGVTIANEDKSVKQYEVVDIINGMDVSDAEAWTLYFSRYDGKAAHDAHKHGIPAELYMNAKLEMENIKPDYINGKEVPGSRRAKIERYLNSVVSDYREYLFLLGTEFESVKKDYDYIMFFGG